MEERKTFGWLKENHPDIYLVCQMERLNQGGGFLNNSKGIDASFENGGFDWYEAILLEDNDWAEILMEESFDHFYEVTKVGALKESMEKPSYDIGSTPSYYIGDKKGIEAMDVVQDFNLNYQVGTAVTYLLRAKRKHDGNDYRQDIIKAINHLQAELDWFDEM